MTIYFCIFGFELAGCNNKEKTLWLNILYYCDSLSWFDIACFLNYKGIPLHLCSYETTCECCLESNEYLFCSSYRFYMLLYRILEAVMIDINSLYVVYGCQFMHKITINSVFFNINIMINDLLLPPYWSIYLLFKSLFLYNISLYEVIIAYNNSLQKFLDLNLCNLFFQKSVLVTIHLIVTISHQSLRRFSIYINTKKILLKLLTIFFDVLGLKFIFIIILNEITTLSCLYRILYYFKPQLPIRIVCFLYCKDISFCRLAYEFTCECSFKQKTYICNLNFLCVLFCRISEAVMINIDSAHLVYINICHFVHKITDNHFCVNFYVKIRKLLLIFGSNFHCLIIFKNMYLYIRFLFAAISYNNNNLHKFICLKLCYLLFQTIILVTVYLILIFNMFLNIRFSYNGLNNIISIEFNCYKPNMQEILYLILKQSSTFSVCFILLVLNVFFLSIITLKNVYYTLERKYGSEILSSNLKVLSKRRYPPLLKIFYDIFVLYTFNFGNCYVKLFDLFIIYRVFEYIFEILHRLLFTWFSKVALATPHFQYNAL